MICEDCKTDVSKHMLSYKVTKQFREITIVEEGRKHSEPLKTEESIYCKKCFAKLKITGV